MTSTKSFIFCLALVSLYSVGYGIFCLCPDEFSVHYFEYLHTQILFIILGGPVRIVVHSPFALLNLCLIFSLFTLSEDRKNGPRYFRPDMPLSLPLPNVLKYCFCSFFHILKNKRFGDFIMNK